MGTWVPKNITVLSEGETNMTAHVTYVTNEHHHQQETTLSREIASIFWRSKGNTAQSLLAVKDVIPLK
jgi:hypothetical protein